MNTLDRGPFARDPHFAHTQRYQGELEAAEARRIRAEARFEELLAADFGALMAEHWGPDWDEKLCAMVRKHPNEPFSIAVIAAIQRQAEKEAG